MTDDMTESKEREPSTEALQLTSAIGHGHELLVAFAIEDCIDARIRRLLPTDCEPRECHEYQTELIAERDRLKGEVATLDEELQQIDDLVEELGGSRDRGPAAFIRDLHAERNAVRADRDRLQRELAAMTEQLTLAVKMNDEIHAADRTANELRAAFTAEKAAHEATRKELANMTKARHDWACISGRFTLRVSTLEAEIESLLAERDELRAQLENEKSAQPERVRLLGNASRLALEWTEERAKLRAELHEMSVACAQWRDAFQSLHTASLAEKAAHEATKRELDALTNQDFLKYHMKAKAYGEMAYKWRKRCVDAGLASEEDRILADEWQGREKALAEERAAHEATRIKLNEARSAVAVGDSTFAGLNAERNKVDIKAAHVAECERHAATLRVAVEDCELAAKERDEARANVYAIGAKLESLRLAHEGALASIQAERDAQAEMRADMLTMEEELESLREPALVERIREIADDALGLQPVDADPVALVEQLEKRLHEYRVAAESTSRQLEGELAGALLNDCEHVHQSTQDNFTAHAAFSRVESALRNSLRSRGPADVVPLEGEMAEDVGMLRAHLTSSNVYQGDMLAALDRIESALRAQPVATEPLDGDLAEDVACLRYAVITKNQRFALDHIALRASVAQEHSHVSAADIDHLEQGCAEAFVSLEARALAGEALAVHQSEWLSAEAARLRAKGAQEPVGPDPVSVLDGWRQRDPQRRQWVVGSRFGQVMVSLQRQGETLAVEFGATEHEARKRMADLIRSGSCGGVEQQPAAPTDEDLANQRLLNREDYYCGACKRQMPRAEARAHVCEEQPAAAPEPRAIVVGSKWRWHDSQSVDTVIAVVPREPYIRARLPSGEEIDPAESLFRAQHTWLSDPPAPAAPELPRKVDQGTTLTVGARYRITEVSPRDICPRHKVGDELLCRSEGDTPGLFTRWFLERWFASDGSNGTDVTGLELVADAPEVGR